MLKPRNEIIRIKPYVPGKPIEEVKRELGLENVIKLASNENPLGPSPRAVAAMEKAGKEMHLYPDGNCFALKQALSQKFEVNEEQLIVGNGSDEVLKILAEAFIYPGDAAIAAFPTFSEYEFVFHVMGGEIRYVPFAGDYPLEAIADAIDGKVKIVFLCNPNNPTGQMIDRKSLEDFLDLLPGNILVVLDEAYGEYVRNPSYPQGADLVREGRHILVLRTFSKIYGLAGLRIGYGIGPEELIANMQRVREPFNVNRMAQLAALAALEDKEHVLRSREVNSRGIDYLEKEFARLRLNFIPTQANFIFVDTGTDCRAVFHKLLKQGVIVRSGDVFGRPDFIRVTVGTEEQNKKFIFALEKSLQEI